MAAAIAPEASFVLLHCIEPFERMLGLAGIDAALVERSRAAARDDAMQRLHALAAEARLPDGRWSATTRVGTAPWVHILSLEQEQDCDLIVIANTARTPSKNCSLAARRTPLPPRAARMC